MRYTHLSFRTDGILNLVKAVKEIEGMDIDNLARRVEALQALTEEPEEKMEDAQKKVENQPVTG